MYSARMSGTVVTALVLTVVVAGCAGSAGSPGPGQPTTPAPGTSNAPSGKGSSASSTVRSGSPAATESNPPGDIPDSQAYVPFTPPSGGVSVKVPEGWARSTAGSTTVFSDKLNRIAIAVVATPATPTVASVTGTDVPRLRSTVPKFALGRITEVHRPAGPVIVTTYRGDSPVDPVTGKVVRDAFERYTYYRSGRRVDLTLVGPVNADNVDPWRIVSDSVRWTR